MNVCIVASGDFFSDYGGGQVYVRNIVDELIHHSEVAISVISLCNNQNSSVKDYHGINVFIVNNESTLQEALYTIHPDIVHANGEKLVTSRVCKQLNIPCVVTAHHGGIVCPAGTLLNTNDEICHIPADYSHCLKCYLRHTPTGLFWYPLLKRISQKRYNEFGKKLKHLPFIPFFSPIGETGMIVSQKLQDWYELCENTTHFIAPSNAIAEALIRNGCPHEKISVIPHGIPQNTVCNQSTTINCQLSTVNFYYVGRINYVKGIHVLLQAFTSIDNPNIELHLIGGAGNKSEQRYECKLKKKYCKDKRIIWHGKLPFEQMTELIKKYHCLIHPAIYLEVFGLSISEALAQHKYVIATRCGGPEMQIHSESDGILVEPNNNEQLATAIKKYISHPKQSNCKIIDMNKHVNDLILLYNKQITE
ncbi:MAG: glycosyltransferase family 4 protein [Bacteroidales bacterium]|nr:glycosyltransferase family 4 protein [Bacteroidales bacterium]